MLTPAGQITKPHGTAGEVLIKINLTALEDSIKEKNFKIPVFLFFEGLPVPFFIEEATHRRGNIYKVRFSTICDLSHAQELAGMSLYSDTPEEENCSTFIGYTVINQENSVIGEVIGIEEFPSNVCLCVKPFDPSLYKGTFLLPLHEDLIIETSREQKRIKLHIPEGLIS